MEGSVPLPLSFPDTSLGV